MWLPFANKHETWLVIIIITFLNCMDLPFSISLKKRDLSKVWVVNFGPMCNGRILNWVACIVLTLFHCNIINFQITSFSIRSNNDVALENGNLALNDSFIVLLVNLKLHSELNLVILELNNLKVIFIFSFLDLFSENFRCFLIICWLGSFQVNKIVTNNCEGFKTILCYLLKDLDFVFVPHLYQEFATVPLLEYFISDEKGHWAVTVFLAKSACVLNLVQVRQRDIVTHLFEHLRRGLHIAIRVKRVYNGTQFIFDSRLPHERPHVWCTEHGFPPAPVFGALLIIIHN